MSGAPESWEQDVTTPVSKLNINATEFVPSWGPPPVISEPSKKLLLLLFYLSFFRKYNFLKIFVKNQTEGSLTFFFQFTKCNVI